MTNKIKPLNNECIGNLKANVEHKRFESECIVNSFCLFSKKIFEEFRILNLSYEHMLLRKGNCLITVMVIESPNRAKSVTDTLGIGLAVTKNMLSIILNVSKVF